MKKTLLITGFAIFIAIFVLSCNNSNSDNHEGTNHNNNSMMSDNHNDANANANQNDMMSENNNVKANKNYITKTFEVKGNCSLCKNRIETAAKSVKGVISANWSIDKKILTLTYKKNLDPAIVLKKIADVGHDNEMFKAPDSVYNKLPKCCLYRK